MQNVTQFLALRKVGHIVQIPSFTFRRCYRLHRRLTEISENPPSPFCLRSPETTSFSLSCVWGNASWIFITAFHAEKADSIGFKKGECGGRYLTTRLGFEIEAFAPIWQGALFMIKKAVSFWLMAPETERKNSWNLSLFVPPKWNEKFTTPMRGDMASLTVRFWPLCPVADRIARWPRLACVSTTN